MQRMCISYGIMGSSCLSKQSILTVRVLWCALLTAVGVVGFFGQMRATEISNGHFAPFDSLPSALEYHVSNIWTT